jgi:uncharacterized Zn-binding protein involved in type VI secretion
MKRYHITEGAKTTAGGKVISATSAITIDGVRAALEGDALYCPACKSAGKIMCVGPRTPETWNGKPVALSDDLCMCGCPSPPKLLPCQTRKFQSLGGAAGLKPTTPKDGDKSASASVTQAPKTPSVDDAFLPFYESTGDSILTEQEEIVEQFFSLLDENDDELEGYRYDLFCSEGSVARSSVFNSGSTSSYTGEAVRLVVWHGRDGAAKDE